VHNLSLRIKIEIIILLTIFIAYFSELLIAYFNELLSRPTISALGLNTFCQHVLLLLFAFSTPFIYFHLLPRQKGIRILRAQPLSPGAALTILLIYYLKYQTILFIVSTPVLIALFATTGSSALLGFGFAICLQPVLYLMFAQMLSTLINEKSKIILSYFAAQFIYFSIFYLLYQSGKFYLFFQLLVVISGAFYLLQKWQKNWDLWDKTLQRFISPTVQSKKRWQRVNYENLPKILPRSIHPFFAREVLSHLRNKNYMRLKLISTILFIFILIVLHRFFDQNYKAIFVLTSIIFIWLHYSHQFNEKYVRSEPKSFFKTTPIRFYQIWLGKFLSEFLIILIYLFIIFIALLLHGTIWQEIVQVVFFIFIFSILVLATTTIFRILFYDNPRSAGYAYHVMIVFVVVMIVNQFYLVGPAITIFLLIYFSYLSHRQLVK
jgi:hypothetical protein